MKNAEIDFVITWVDGSDPEWIEEKNKYENNDSESKFDNLTDVSDARYRDWGLLRYWFRSIEEYAPWVRKIHFVTWGHVPEWLDLSNPKINIVKHSDFIPPEYLPTFNSHTIELNLHRIEDLAEQFVYFNDDMFLNKPSNPEDFFKNGLPRDVFALDCIYFSKSSAGLYNANDLCIINEHFVARECRKKYRNKWYRLQYGLKNIYKTVALSYKGWFPGFYYSHTHGNYLKTTFKTLWEEEYQVLDETCKDKFRSKTNVNQWLMKYWQLASGNFEPQKRKFSKCFHINCSIDAVLNEIREGKYSVICINDTVGNKNFDAFSLQCREAYESKLRKKSTFEK